MAEIHPINAFPKEVQKILYHYSESKGYPIEYFIQGFLGAASTALGRSVTLRAGAFTSIANIWCIILGKKGYTKSEPLDDAFKPIRDYQFKLIAEHKASVDEQEFYRMQNPKARVAPIPEPKKHVVNDSTPEKLIVMLSENPKGLGIVYDEIAGFVGRFNRYNNGGDEQMFLSLFNGSSVMRDRMNGASAYAKTTYLTIIGTTQPTILKEVFSPKSESGFFDRWLITQPEGFKKQYPNQYGINPIEERKYAYIIQSLLNIQYDEYNDFQMQYNAESYAIVRDFQCWMVDQQNETDSDDYRGILAKMEIYLHKFALLLQSIIWTQTNQIEYVSKEAAEGAVILTKYFIEQAQNVRVSSPVDHLKDKWVDVYLALPEYGTRFDRKHFVKVCKTFGFSERAADKFLKENGMRSERTILFKVQHGVYTKNLF